jgi:hypothetical protein
MDLSSVPVELDALKNLLADLMRQYGAADEASRRAERDKLKIRTAIAAILAITTEEPLEYQGTLADACRAVVRDSATPLEPTAVRDGIIALGYNLTQHKNPLASIHSVLKRLAQSGDLRKTVSPAKAKDGTAQERTVYEWASQPKKPARAAQGRPFYGLDTRALTEALSGNRLMSEEIRKRFQVDTEAFRALQLRHNFADLLKQQTAGLSDLARSFNLPDKTGDDK